MSAFRTSLRGFLSAALALLLAACGGEPVRPVFHEAGNPRLLSEWGAVAVRDTRLVLGEGVFPYALRTPLFTDYAHKLRTVWTTGGPATLAADGSLDFPVGTVITKTFYYPTSGEAVLRATDAEGVNGSVGLDLTQHRLIETRLLVRREDGWHPVSYLWNEDQTDAVLKRTGAVVPLTLADGEAAEAFAYVVPNENQCGACHAPNATTKRIRPLGPSAAQLDRPYDYAEGRRNQLVHLSAYGILDGVAGIAAVMPAWDDEEASLDARARSYLAANCAHCHNPEGPADTSGLDLTLAASGPALGICKPPIAAGSGTGGHRFGIVPGRADRSILVHRVASTDPGAMMPELGRSLAHREGVDLLTRWIDAMEGTCPDAR